MSSQYTLPMKALHSLFLSVHASLSLTFTLSMFLAAIIGEGESRGVQLVVFYKLNDTKSYTTVFEIMFTLCTLCAVAK